MNKMKRKILLMVLGFTCNNNCIFCSASQCRSRLKDKTFSEISKDLENGREQDYDYVEFIGGEPTIRKDFISILKKARELGYKTIAITTNGRMFSNPSFTKKTIDAGLDYITFSLHGHNSKLNDSITRTPGSFDQIIQGIKNILEKTKNKEELGIMINTVVCKFNYKYLTEIAKLLTQLKIEHWSISDLIPDGNAKQSYKSLSVRLFDLRMELEKLSNYSKHLEKLYFLEFPYCVLPKKTDSMVLLSKPEDASRVNQIGFNPTDTKSSLKTKIPYCNDCKFNKRCGGIWKEYINKFGEGDIKNG